MAKVIRKDDANFKKLKKNLRNGNTSSFFLEAGIFNKKASRSANGSKADNLAYRARIHDQGLGPAYRGKKPRAFIDPTIDEFTKKHLDKVMRQVLSSLHNSAALDKSLTFGANRLAGVMIQRMKKTRAKSPFSRSRSSTPLVDTGDLIKAVKGRVR